MKSIYSNPSPITGSLNNLSNVKITNPQNDQVLTYENGLWINQAGSGSSGVSSFNTRVGNVFPTAGDYSISQITNSSVLANSSNVGITSPANGQYLSYNGSQWVNSNLSNTNSYYTAIKTSAASFTAASGIWYKIGSVGCVVTLATPVVSDKFMFSCGNNTTINFPASSTVTNSPFGGISNPVIVATSCLIEIMCNATLGGFTFELLRVVQTGTSSSATINGSKLCEINKLSYIGDVTLTSPTLNDYFKYNGTNWINSPFSSSDLPNSGVTAGTYNNLTVNAKGIATAGANVSYLQSVIFSPVSPIAMSGLGGGGELVNGNTVSVSLANSGVSAGTYSSVTVNGKGLVTAGTNPSVVTSVALSLPSIFSVSGSPVTSTGTLTGTLNSQSANLLFSSPDGSAGTPTFRALTNGDLPISGVTAGTYNSVTVNTKGIITAASNVSAAVSSVFGRTGAVVAATNDYSITQIQNSSVLANSTNLNISSPAKYEALTYNSGTSKWYNQFRSDYITVAENNSGGTFTADINTFYTIANGTIMNIPSLPPNGTKIGFQYLGGSTCTINFPPGIPLKANNNTYTAPVLTSSSQWGTVEFLFVNASNINWIMTDIRGTWTINGTDKTSTVSDINNINNVAISGATAGQILAYNGTSWINSTPGKIFNTAGLVTSPKVFSDQTTTNASGVFTLSLASASFTNVYSVQVTAILGGSNASNAPIATVQTFSTTSVTGLVVKSNSIGNGLTNAGSGIVVYVTVTGN